MSSTYLCHIGDIVVQFLKRFPRSIPCLCLPALRISVKPFLSTGRFQNVVERMFSGHGVNVSIRNTSTFLKEGCPILTTIFTIDGRSYCDSYSHISFPLVLVFDPFKFLIV